MAIDRGICEFSCVLLARRIAARQLLVPFEIRRCGGRSSVNKSRIMLLRKSFEHQTVVRQNEKEMVL